MKMQDFIIRVLWLSGLLFLILSIFALAGGATHYSAAALVLGILFTSIAAACGEAQINSTSNVDSKKGGCTSVNCPKTYKDYIELSQHYRLINFDAVAMLAVELSKSNNDVKTNGLDISNK